MVGFLLLPLIPWFRHGNRPWILIALFAVLLIQGTVIQANWKFHHHLSSIGMAFLIVVVGRASAFGQYFFYGTDLSNHVQYVGQQLNRGTFRPIDTCSLWRRTVN